MISPLHFDRCLANGIRNWSAPFTKHGSVFSTVNQNHSNVSFWICMWVWELAVISTVEVKKKWIQYPFLICVDASICRKMLCKGVSCCEWFIISDAILIETISAIIGSWQNYFFPLILSNWEVSHKSWQFFSAVYDVYVVSLHICMLNMPTE